MLQKNVVRRFSSSTPKVTPFLKSGKTLRSQGWFGKDHGRDGVIHRSWMRRELQDHHFDGSRPIIGIANTWSELTPCNGHFRELAEHVKRGVLEAGGVPLEFPVLSPGETNMRPTAMLYRNLLAMDTEEMLRANPIDGCVLLAGCDKTTPGLLMGAASVGLPSILLSGGPMLNGKFKGGEIGSGTHVWRFSEMVSAGTMSEEDFNESEACMSRSRGHCMTMGTASTMACVAEALGTTLPQNAAIPAPDTRRLSLAQATGRRVVDMVRDDLTIEKILTREAFENAIIALAAIGGSTNAVVHLLALAGRVGVQLNLKDFDVLGKHQPLLVNLMPSGKYLMEDFYYAGGLPSVLRELLESGQLREQALTVNGKTMSENVKKAPNYNRDVIAAYSKPIKPEAGIAVLKGNLAPNGCVIKPSAASPHLFNHTGRAVVFESIEDLKARGDSDDLDVDESCILVLKGAGPVGYPGMPEVGNFSIPKKLLKKGVTDMVRISDARMSGTAYGTVVLHASPESAVGGPLALIKNGDKISINVREGTLNILISDEELEARRKLWVAPKPVADRGYVSMYIKEVQQADKGADFGYLIGSSGRGIPRESH
jgi:dihydroxy-acid dehydratase